MILAWALWPLIVLGSVLVRAVPRLLRRWYVPLLSGLIAFPLNFVALLILPYSGPEKFNTDNNLAGFAFLVRWWGRWRVVGPAQLLSNGWISQHQPYPTGKELFLGFLHVSLAASVTVAGLGLLLAVLLALRDTLRSSTDPFPGGRP